MVVHNDAANNSPVDPTHLDLGYLSFFLGLRVNELVVKRLVSAGFSNVRQSHGYVFQHLIERDRTITELARRMRVTQQAVSKTVAQMVKLGILESVIAADRRTRTVRLSERGWESVKLARKARRVISVRLRKAIGVAKYNAATKILEECLSELGGIQTVASRRIREPR